MIQHYEQHHHSPLIGVCENRYELLNFVYVDFSFMQFSMLRRGGEKAKSENMKHNAVHTKEERV